MNNQAAPAAGEGRGKSARGLAHHVLIVGALLLAGGCAPERIDDDPGVPPAVVERTPADRPAAPPGSVGPPDADGFLPRLPGYATDDEAESGELEASLDHGSVPYHEVRRRLVLDDRGFASAEVTVVTLHPEAGAAEHLLDHRFGDVPWDSVRIGGEEMIRMETEPFATIAWIGPGFVVTFQRGQERSEPWLEEFVRATLGAIAAEARDP